MAKRKSKKDPLEGKVLVPKVGKEAEFFTKFEEIKKIANGSLGWTGQAEMMYDILGKAGLQDFLGIKLKARKKENLLKEIELLLKESFYHTLMTYGEWITQAAAAKRAKLNKVLFEEVPR
jgi:hypothetical protein